MLKIFSRSNDPRRFIRQLSILMNAGIPLSRAITSAFVPKELQEKVTSGSAFSAALDEKLIPPSVISIINVGEKSGDLAGGLARALRYMEKNDAFRKKLVASLTYPAFVLLVCLAAMLMLTSVLLPAYSGTFSSLGVALPPITRAMIAISHRMPLIFILAAASIFLAARHVMSDRGFYLPIAGSFRRKLVYAAMFRAMAQSMEAGLSLIDSIELASASLGSGLYRRKMASLASMVKEGQRISEAFVSCGPFDESIIHLISAGEQSSSLDKVFAQLADMYEQEVESAVKTFSSLIEPASTLITGLVVGVIVFAMFLPMIKLIGILGG